MHTVQLLLKTSKYERHEIDRRFHALAHLHNDVKHARGMHDTLSTISDMQNSDSCRERW